MVEKVFFLEVRPVFCYWINPRPPLDAFYRPTLIEMSLENGCARVLFNRPRWFFSSFFLPSRWSFVIVPFFPRLRSRERPSRTSANYLQLEIREEEKKGSRFTFSSRFRIDFQRRLFSILFEISKRISLSIYFFLLWNFYSFTISNKEYDPNLMIASTKGQRVGGSNRVAWRVDRSAERRLAWLDRRVNAVENTFDAAPRFINIHRFPVSRLMVSRA